MPTKHCVEQHKRNRLFAILTGFTALIAILAVLSLTTSAVAQRRHFHPHDHFRHGRIHHPHHGWVWVVPTVVGGVVAYELLKREPQVSPPTKTLVCGPWVEREVGGQVVRERQCLEEKP